MKRFIHFLLYDVYETDNRVLLWLLDCSIAVPLGGGFALMFLIGGILNLVLSEGNPGLGVFLLFAFVLMAGLIWFLDSQFRERH